MHNNNDIIEEWWLLKTSRFTSVAFSLSNIFHLVHLLSGDQRDLSKQIKHFMFMQYVFPCEKWDKKIKKF